MATVIPHNDSWTIDTIKVAGAANSTAVQKRNRAKAQMVAAGYSN